MINKDRIIPITKVDYLSLISTIMALNDPNMVIISSADVEGNFDISGSGVVGLLNQPAKSIDIDAESSIDTIYFVPDYGFKGITADGEEIELAEGSVEVDASETELYSLVYDDPAYTLLKVTLPAQA